MKYIIDLPDNCSWGQWVMTSDKDGHAFFDFKQPRDLTPLDKELEEAFHKGYNAAWVNVGECEDRVAKQAYQKGLENAWECARRLVWETSLNEAEHMGFIAKEESAEILRDYTVTAAMKAVELYDEKQNKCIMFGDGLVTKHGGVNGIALSNEVNRCVYVWREDCVAYEASVDEWKKTGKTYSQLAELLEAMKGKQRGCSTCKYSDGSDVSKCSDCCLSKGYNKWEGEENV